MTVVQMKGADSSAANLPVSIETEQALLGALLIHNPIYPAVASIVNESHFSEQAHRVIWRAASEMIAAKQTASPITLAPYLPKELVPGLTVASYLARLVAEALPPGLAPDHARTVRDLALRRSLIETGEELARYGRAASLGDTPSLIASDAIRALQDIAATSSSADTRKEAAGAASDLLAHTRLKLAGQEQDDAISTGIPDLNRETGGGFHPGDLWIVGGRPGQGKSILASVFASRISRRGVGALLFSLELTEQQMIARILSDLSYRPTRRIVFSDIVSGKLDETDMVSLDRAQAHLAEMPFSIDFASRLTIPEIAARVRAEKSRMAKRGVKLGVVFIDYLKMVAASDRYRGNRVMEVGEISGALKQLAKDEGICVVLLSQLNRASVGPEKKDKRPDLLALRDSGDLEADADVVAFIHRESYYIAQSPEYRNNEDDAIERFLDKQFQGEIILAKTRLGAPGTVPIWCDVACSTFSAADWREMREAAE